MANGDWVIKLVRPDKIDSCTDVNNWIKTREIITGNGFFSPQGRHVSPINRSAPLAKIHLSVQKLWKNSCRNHQNLEFFLINFPLTGKSFARFLQNSQHLWYFLCDSLYLLPRDAMHSADCVVRRRLSVLSSVSSVRLFSARQTLPHPGITIGM